ncbi:hypothetical protein FH972_023516 [Carpinus fangiana]|uniref:Beta-mannosidase A n=1 Tax=Carpinus fangiana TaxID=176857 RepID=A0A5N6KXP1_9ROSI|nr:hypothetical protein FH972_023516 [Carpinus fangiana]
MLSCLLPLSLPALAAAQTVLDLTQVPWTLTEPTHNISIVGKVPSQAHLDLLAAGVIEEPTYGQNEIKDRWVANANFTDPTQETHLVFDGIDTFADITFCRQWIGSVDNQFRSYTFDVSSTLKSCTGPPQLKLDFTSSTSKAATANETYQCPECLGTRFEFPGRQFIRKEQCDYGWDWGPGFAPTGIWQPARIVQLPSDGIYVQNTGVDVYRQGQLNNIPPDQKQPWVLNVTLDYLGSLPDNVAVSTDICDENGDTLFKGSLEDIKMVGNQLSGNVTIDQEPKLWWPVGHGAQQLYNMTLTVTSGSNAQLAIATTRIGFRTIVLNQTPVSEEQIAKGIAPGNNWHFEINGQDIYSKGSNVIPLDPFWPRVTKEDIRDLFQSAVAMNHNMLRVWAGGVYLPDFVYDLADEMGLLLWTEFQFSDALSPVEPKFVSNIAAEAGEQVRRLNSHPSTALWCGNNENGLLLLLLELFDQSLYPAGKENFEKVFNEILVHAVFENSRSLSYLPTSTSNGYKSFDRSRERPFEIRYQDDLYAPDLAPGAQFSDNDFYNYNTSQAFTQSTYPVGRFTNEFGFHSHASYQTYVKSLPASQLSFNSSDILARNRHYETSYADLVNNAQKFDPGNQTAKSLTGQAQMSSGAALYFPTPHKQPSSPSAALFSGPNAQFAAEIHATQLFQAAFVRAQIDFYRRGAGYPERNLGALFWMLGDTWAAPTWAALNVDGRWKPLAYAARAAFESVVAAPFVDDQHGIVTWSVSSDAWAEVAGTARLEWYTWSGARVETPHAWTREVRVGATNSSALQGWEVVETLRAALPGAVGILTLDVTLEGSGERFESQRAWTPHFLSHASQVDVMVDPELDVAYDAKASAEAGEGESVFTVTAKALAGHVWLEEPEVAGKGYWSDNSFWMLPGKTSVTWTSYGRGKVDVQDWAGEVKIGSVWDLTTP